MSDSKLDRTADETKHEITPINQKMDAKPIDPSPPQASNISDQELEDNLRNVLQSFDAVDQQENPVAKMDDYNQGSNLENTNLEQNQEFDMDQEESVRLNSQDMNTFFT